MPARNRRERRRLGFAGLFFDPEDEDGMFLRNVG
jgi:hypothetical protein